MLRFSSGITFMIGILYTRKYLTCKTEKTSVSSIHNIRLVMEFSLCHTIKRKRFWYKFTKRNFVMTVSINKIIWNCNHTNPRNKIPILLWTFFGFLKMEVPNRSTCYSRRLSFNLNLFSVHSSKMFFWRIMFVFAKQISTSTHSDIVKK